MTKEVIILLTFACINALLSLFVIIGSKKRTNIIYSIFVFFISCWSVGIAYFYLINDLRFALYIANFYYVSAALIASFFLLFSFTFSKTAVRANLVMVIALLPLIVFPLIFFFNEHAIIKNVFNGTEGKSVVLNKLNYLIYSAYFVLLIIFSYWKLARSFVKNTDSVERTQLGLIISGTLLGYIPAMIFNLVLPFFDIYKWIWLGPIFSVFMIISIGYAVTKHHLFDIKVVTTELITFTMWLFVLMRTVLADTTNEKILNAALLAILILFGILLIRSVLREVEQRENLEKLRLKLESTNMDLETANEKLKGLDKLKTEFLSLASHQLRSPLTAIKGYTSMLLDGDFGVVNDKQKEAIDRVFQSSKHLTTVVEDLLNVSKIEQGGMQYIMAPFDFEKAVHDLATDLSVTAEKKGLKLTFESDGKAPYTVNGDMEKIRQVILNLIDNSVKYTATGWIKVSVTKDEATKKIKFAVSDSGMGISPATINDLFQKFSRGAGGKVNTGGSGLGLYLGKEIIAAHKGRIWAESPGEGKGSTFAVELDMG